MNLYRGCRYGRIYCDTKSDCYGISNIPKISFKKNALEITPEGAVQVKSKKNSNKIWRKLYL